MSISCFPKRKSLRSPQLSKSPDSPMLTLLPSAGKTLEEVVHIFENPDGIRNIGTPAWKTRVDRRRAQDVESHGGTGVEKAEGDVAAVQPQTSGGEGEKVEGRVAEVQPQMDGTARNSDENTEGVDDDHQCRHDTEEPRGENGEVIARQESHRCGEKVDGVSVVPNESLGIADKSGHDYKDEGKGREEDEDAEKRWRRHIAEVMVRAMLKMDMVIPDGAWSTGPFLGESIDEETRVTAVSEMGMDKKSENDTFGLDGCLKFTPRKAEAMVGTGQEGLQEGNGV